MGNTITRAECDDLVLQVRREINKLKGQIVYLERANNELQARVYKLEKKNAQEETIL